MDPIVTAQILNAARLIHERMEGLADRLDAVTSKIDQLVYREMKSAYDALQAALITSNPSTREQRLAFAENALLLNTGLKEQLSTDDRPNADIMACAHFGLSYIAFLRDDKPIAARHLLQSFEIAPRLSREVLAPQLYEKLFLPRCRLILEAHQQKVLSLDPVGSSRRRPESWDDHLVYWIDKATGYDPDTVSKTDYDGWVAGLERIRNEKVDKCCTAIARKYLRGDVITLAPAKTITHASGEVTFESDNFVGVIKASNDRYALTSYNDVIYCSSEFVSFDETFTFMAVGSGCFAMQSPNLRFVQANRDNNNVLEARGEEVGEWEVFRLVNNGEDRYSIYSVNTGMFVRADREREGILIADRKEVREWEIFHIDVAV